jgi:AcrR family transcriptional regulator
MSAEEALRGQLPTRLRQRLLTRSVILEAAIDEIAERGLDGARIGEIARRAGVTRPTIYAHFPTKADFLRELETRTQATLLVELRSRLGGPDVSQLAERLVDALFDLLTGTNPNLRREVFALVVREPETADWLGNPLFGFLTERFSAAQARDEIDSSLPAPELTRVVVTALFGFVVVEAEAVEVRRQAAHHMMGLLIRAPGAAGQRKTPDPPSTISV